MKPYYSEDGITIFCADCRDVLPSLHEFVLVTDPPYGIGLGVDKDMRGGEHGLAKRPYLSYEDTYENFLELIPPVIEAALLRARRGAVFMSGHRIHDLPRPDAIGGIYLPAAIGRHCWGFNSFLPVLFYGKDPKLNGGDTPSAISRSDIAEKNGHPCAKPYPWMRWLIHKVSLEEDLILDPFLGSGTTLRAAKDLGRKGIGIEINESYCEIAAKRLSQKVLAFP